MSARIFQWDSFSSSPLRAVCRSEGMLQRYTMVHTAPVTDTSTRADCRGLMRREQQSAVLASSRSEQGSAQNGAVPISLFSYTKLSCRCPAKLSLFLSQMITDVCSTSLHSNRVFAIRAKCSIFFHLLPPRMITA